MILSVPPSLDDFEGILLFRVLVYAVHTLEAFIGDVLCKLICCLLICTPLMRILQACEKECIQKS